MTAKQQAILDIQEELEKDSKCFIAFIVDLDPIMNTLVKNYIKLQEGK